MELVHGRISCPLLLDLASKKWDSISETRTLFSSVNDRKITQEKTWIVILHGFHERSELLNEWNDAEIQLTNVAETGSSIVLGPSSSSGAPGTVISPSMSTFTAVGTKPGSDAILNFYFPVERCWPNENSAGVVQKILIGPRSILSKGLPQMSKKNQLSTK